MSVVNESTFVAVGFALFVVLIWRKAATAIGAMLDQRSAKIESELQEAQNLREEAAAELKKFQRLAREAADEAKTILSNAEATAERITKIAEEKAEASIARREKQAAMKIEAAEAAVIADLRAQSATLAVTAAKHVMAEKLDADASLALIEESVKQLDDIKA